MMKKAILILSASMMLFALTACQNDSVSATLDSERILSDSETSLTDLGTSFINSESETSDIGYSDDLISIGHTESGMEQVEEKSGVEPSPSINITLTSGDTVVTATLDDSTIAKEFAALLPQTVSMSRVGGGREFYGRLQGNLNYDESDAQTTFENGDIAYWFSGNGLCLLYNNQVDNPEIESGIIVFGKITSDEAV